MNYVVGDIHGCYKELLALLNEIDNKDPNADVWFLGDFIDRGPDSLLTLEWAMKNISSGGKYKSLLGNHEDMLLSWIKDRLDKKETFNLKYGFDRILMQEGYNTFEKLSEIYDFLSSLELRQDISVVSKTGKEIEYVLVHAWAPDAMSEGERKGKLKRNIYLWERQCDGNEYTDKIIVHGHTPTIAPEYSDSDFTSEGLIGYRKNAINLDGGSPFYKKYCQFPCMIGCICLETLEEIYPYTIEKRFLQFEEEGLISSARDSYENYKRTRMQVRNFFREEMVSRMY